MRWRKKVTMIQMPKQEIPMEMSRNGNQLYLSVWCGRALWWLSQGLLCGPIILTMVVATTSTRSLVYSALNYFSLMAEPATTTCKNYPWRNSQPGQLQFYGSSIAFLARPKGLAWRRVKQRRLWIADLRPDYHHLMALIVGLTHDRIILISGLIITLCLALPWPLFMLWPTTNNNDKYQYKETQDQSKKRIKTLQGPISSSSFKI